MKPTVFALVTLLVLNMSPPALAEGEPAMRIRPLELNEWSPKILNKLKGIGRVRIADDGNKSPTEEKDDRPRLPGMLKTVAHHPEIMEELLDFATVITHNGALTSRDSELLAMRVAWNCQSEFEWGHHLEYALNAGISRAEVERIPAGPTADGWSDADRALLYAADQLHAKQDITDEVWAKLAARYSDKQLVEILFVVGEYTMLSMVVNASGVELEEGYESLPEIAPAK